MHPLARRLGRGKDAVEVNSQYDVFDSLFFPSFRAHPSYGCSYVCMHACRPSCVSSGPAETLPNIIASCGSHRREECSILENAQCRCTRHGAPVPPCTSILKTAVCLFFLFFFFHACFYAFCEGGRHFRSEFATKWRVATVVTGNEAQFGHTVWKLMFLLLKSTKIWFF